MRMRHAAVVAGLALELMSGQVKAETLKFSFNGIYQNSDNIRIDFSLPSNPKPNETAENIGFVIDNVPFDLTVASANRSTDANIGFYDMAVGGGFGFQYTSANSISVKIFGQQLFSGKETSPVFTQGSYVLSGAVFDPSGNIEPGLSVAGTLTISSVPLPASAPMFGAAVLALGAVGYGVKRKKVAAG